MIPAAEDDARQDGLAGDSPHHRLNNALSRIIACAEGAIDAADNPSEVRTLMELIITCAESATASCVADPGTGSVGESHARDSVLQRRRTP